MQLLESIVRSIWYLSIQMQHATKRAARSMIVTVLLQRQRFLIITIQEIEKVLFAFLVNRSSFYIIVSIIAFYRLRSDLKLQLIGPKRSFVSNDWSKGTCRKR